MTEPLKDLSIGARLKENMDRSRAEFLQEDTARIEAKQIIYTHVSKWAGRTVEVGDPIPILQDTTRFGPHCVRELTSTIINSINGVDAVRNILEAAKLLKRNDLQEKLQDLEELKRSIDETLQKLLNADPMILAKAEFAGGCTEHTLEHQIVRVLTPKLAASVGLESIAKGLDSELQMVRLQLQRCGAPRRGAQRHLAAYEVAYNAARLLAVVTGARPSYSEEHLGTDNPNAHYGRFTPFLRDLFDAFGWKERTLRGPRVSDLLCLSNLAHASPTKEHDNNDDFQGITGRAAERRGTA